MQCSQRRHRAGGGRRAAVALVLGAAALAGCGQADWEGGRPSGPPAEQDLSDQETATMELTSTAFRHGEPIPPRYGEDGSDVSPPLAWSGAPDGVRGFALVCEDPDAPSPRRPRPEPWVHWVIYNIPGDVSELREGLPRAARLASPPGVRQGLNSWPSNNVGYRGPAPPPGSGRHRYFFRLYALDTELDLPPEQATRDALLAAIKGHVLAQAELMGTYERK